MFSFPATGFLLRNPVSQCLKEEGRGKREEGRGKREEGRRKKEEGRRKREEARRKKEEGRRKREDCRGSARVPTLINGLDY
jgi:hypothetical protein